MQYRNYCGWDCSVGEAKAMGGTVHSPNGLPPHCIHVNGDMYEIEGAEHPDYMFPVTAVYCGPTEEAPHFTNGLGDRVGSEDLNASLQQERHALIYTDSFIAVTLYEHTYAMWEVADGGKIERGRMWKQGHWRLDDKSLNDIKNRKYST